MFNAPVRVGDFPENLGAAETERALDDLQAFRDVSPAELEDFAALNRHLPLGIGRKLVAVSWLFTTWDGRVRIDKFEDGSRVPDLRMHRVVDGRHVMVRPLRGHGKVELSVRRNASVCSLPQMDGHFPFSESWRASRLGCYISERDDLSDHQYWFFEDHQDNILPMIPPMQRLTGFVLDAVANGQDVAPDYLRF